MRTFNKTVKKDFEFAYNPPLTTSVTNEFVTHETYTFVADVAVGVSSKIIGDGQMVELSYFVKMKQIRKYRVDKPGFDEVDLDTVLKAHTKDNPEIRREITEAIAYEAIEKMPLLNKFSVGDLMAELALENSAGNGRKI